MRRAGGEGGSGRVVPSRREEAETDIVQLEPALLPANEVVRRLLVKEAAIETNLYNNHGLRSRNAIPHSKAGDRDCAGRRATSRGHDG